MNVSSMNSERKLCVQSTIEKESAVVVLYLHSTSSHNARGKQTSQSLVVLYLHSTSNHNCADVYLFGCSLYYIFILHQTTTPVSSSRSRPSLYYIFILHQTTTIADDSCQEWGCIISSFYIKPQLGICAYTSLNSCIISSFYIKPQLRAL